MTLPCDPVLAKQGAGFTPHICFVWVPDRSGTLLWSLNHWADLSGPHTWFLFNETVLMNRKLFGRASRVSRRDTFTSTLSNHPNHTHTLLFMHSNAAHNAYQATLNMKGAILDWLINSKEVLKLIKPQHIWDTFTRHIEQVASKLCKKQHACSDASARTGKGRKRDFQILRKWGAGI